MSEGLDSDQLGQQYLGPPWDAQGPPGGALTRHDSFNWIIKEKIRMFIFEPGGQATIFRNQTMMIQELLDAKLNRMGTSRTGPEFKL
jgi:hypothetical protein